jgi:hypothetical protein
MQFERLPVELNARRVFHVTAQKRLEGLAEHGEAGHRLLRTGVGRGNGSNSDRDGRGNGDARRENAQWGARLSGRSGRRCRC